VRQALVLAPQRLVAEQARAPDLHRRLNQPKGDALVGADRPAERSPTAAYCIASSMPADAQARHINPITARKNSKLCMQRMNRSPSPPINSSAVADRPSK
jgi:hypothetical protein